MNAQTADTYTHAVTFTDEPEEALSALRGVSCILNALAESSTTIGNHKEADNAYWILGQVTGAAAEKLYQCIDPNE